MSTIEKLYKSKQIFVVTRPNEKHKTWAQRTHFYGWRFYADSFRNETKSHLCICCDAKSIYSSIHSSSAASSPSSRCCNFGCFRRDEPFFTFGFCVVVAGGFSKSSNCLSVRMPLYQSALCGANKHIIRIYMNECKIKWVEQTSNYTIFK